MSHVEFDEARAAVAAAARRLAAAGLLIGTAGNVSLAVGDHVAVTATGVRLADTGPEHVTVVDPAGRVVAGELAPTSELELHLGVYARFDVGAVVHTHAVESTALSLAVDEIPCVHYQQLLLGGAIRVAPFATFGTPELAAHVLAALEGKRAALLANHGAVTLGTDLNDAVENTLLLEWVCEIYRKATVLGPVRALDEAQQLAVVDAALRRGYGTTHRLEEQDL